MSLTILKAGLLDTVQDLGRTGYRRLGIGPTGCMDWFSAAIANLLVRQPRQAAVLEMHFPAARIQFNIPVRIALAGADFGAMLDGKPVPLHRPVAVRAGAVLECRRRVDGARLYLAVGAGLAVPDWLGSSSTHLKAGVGGWQGRALRTGDVIPFQQETASVILDNAILPVRANILWGDPYPGVLAITPGPEWHLLHKKNLKLLENEPFIISRNADRMGYRLNGAPFLNLPAAAMLSSGADFGTVQLLPDGQLIILMADGQTTGGYPRIAQVVRAHLPKLAQLGPGEALRFKQIAPDIAEAMWERQDKHLTMLENSELNFL